MSGHSKWSTIKRKKGAADAKRGRIFTRIIREITVAARAGGGDINGNARLRQAVLDAKANNMPSDNIERGIKKGTGELEGTHYEEITYEGYGPGGVAVLVQTMTDNRNRTTADVRHAFSKHGGNMGEAGCVAWMFYKKGLLVFEKSEVDEDKLMEAAVDAGADDFNDAESVIEVMTEPGAYEGVRGKLEAAGFKPVESSISMIPQTTVKLQGKQAEQMIKLVSLLEDLDDVQDVYANFDISEEEIERLG